jgi:signal transduction histidine kinase
MPKHLNSSQDEHLLPGQAERFFNDIKIEFLVHELKDPVSVIETALRSLTERRERYGDLTSRQERTLKRALRSSKKIRQMLNDLLEIGRSQAACFVCHTFQPVRATMEVLMDALETVACPIFEEAGRISDEQGRFHYLSSCGIHWKVDPEVSNLQMVQDETKFRQIVSNLIKNALYHRNEQLEVRLSQEKSKLHVDVSDDGPGIAPEHHQLIFKQYMQLDHNPMMPRSGHGLGLAGAIILARCLGGNILIRSKKGQGANFQLVLPIVFENP